MALTDDLRVALRDARILAERAGYDDTADALESIELELDAADSMDTRYQREVADRDKKLASTKQALAERAGLYTLLRSGDLPGVEITAEGLPVTGDALDAAIGRALTERSNPKIEEPRTLLGGARP